MITFQQLCEHLTCNQRHPWFLLENSLFDMLTQDEKSHLRVKQISDGWTRCWYPVNKFYERVIDDIEFNKLITEALEKEDYMEITKLKKGRIIV